MATIAIDDTITNCKIMIDTRTTMPQETIVKVSIFDDQQPCYLSIEWPLGTGDIVNITIVRRRLAIMGRVNRLRRNTCIEKDERGDKIKQLRGSSEKDYHWYEISDMAPTKLSKLVGVARPSRYRRRPWDKSSRTH